jgi:hypothetical protein
MAEPIALTVATVTLLTAAIEASGEIIGTYISKRDMQVDTTSLVSKNEYYENIIKERKLNEEFIKNAVNKAADNLSSVIEHISEYIVDEMRKMRLREVIQEVQACADTLGTLSTLSKIQSMDQEIFMRMLVTSIIPLQISLGKAKFAIQDYGNEYIWRFCHIVGTSALMAGYEFLGQDMPHLREELEKSMKYVQIEILNEVATKIIPLRRSFPWEEIPLLLSPEGIKNLTELYNSTFELEKHEETGKSFPSENFKNIAERVEFRNIAERVEFIKGSHDINLLIDMRKEENSKERKSPQIITALDNRIKELRKS